MFIFMEECLHMDGCMCVCVCLYLCIYVQMYVCVCMRVVCELSVSLAPGGMFMPGGSPGGGGSIPGITKIIRHD